jgi:hypothetical protein
LPLLPQLLLPHHPTRRRKCQSPLPLRHLSANS